MPQFSLKSNSRLQTCDSRLIRVMERAIVLVPRDVDFTVLCGFRSEAEQDKAFKEGHSTLRYPRSKHNKMPSLAVDVVPYPIDWEDLDRFYRLATYIYQAAIREQVYNIRWGGHWTRFQDFPHWEIVDDG